MYRNDKRGNPCLHVDLRVEIIWLVSRRLAREEVVFVGRKVRFGGGVVHQDRLSRTRRARTAS